ncbi:sulfotransferase [Litorimonas sp. RW-G-Af-16]|uniref:tetratricopeptide repeat-containing sulfotransferase family protein n=1 Tax=Litorimonas sp. RW-G-Af-16 TaxID=3241168 RepID=UPI003AAA702A
MASLTVQTGLNALKNKRYEAVHAECIAEIKENISNPVPYFLLGAIAADHGNIKKALELFSKAEALDAENAFYPAFIGKTYAELRQSSDAKLAADRAVNCEIRDAFVADIIGVIYSRCGAHARAVPMFERAVELDPTPANYYYNLGASAQFLGDFSKADKAYQNAIARDPHHYRAWASKVSLTQQTESQNYLSDLKTLFTDLQGHQDATHQIGHAIAKTLEDIGRHEDSFDWLYKAKAAKRAEFPYDRVAGRETFAAAAATTDIPPARNPNGGAPIFVVGLPRTDTTLVDRILSSHSKVQSAGELSILSNLVKDMSQTTSKYVLDAETLHGASSIDLDVLGRDYMRLAEERLERPGQFVDKMPFNFFYAGLISKALPNAKIIALRRGAMDSCLSNYRQLLSVQESFYNYTFDLEDTAFFYSQFDGLMTHWRTHLPKQNFIEIRYEEIVYDQENQTRRLLDFCGLNFEEPCLRFHENISPVSTASSVQVRQPLYSGSIGRWKKYANKLDGLRNALGDLAD